MGKEKKAKYFVRFFLIETKYDRRSSESYSITKNAIKIKRYREKRRTKSDDIIESNQNEQVGARRKT